MHVLLRKIVDPRLDYLGAQLARLPVTANAATLASFVCGMGGAGMVAIHKPLLGLFLIALSWLLRGLHGLLARQSGISAAGDFLDIVFRQIVCASVPFAFALANPDHALAAAFLILSFVALGASAPACAIVVARRAQPMEPHAGKPFPRVGGATEEMAVFAAFAVACLWPEKFSVVAYVFGVVCFVASGSRVAMALDVFS